MTTPFSRRPRLVDAGLLVGMLLAGVACTGELRSGAGSTSELGPDGKPLGTGGGDPYAIPAEPPAPVLVETPRFARLSRQQWANAVRDLLMLSDVSDIESDVSGDALVGFDNEAEGLFVTEQLRPELFDAAEKAADIVTGDAAALERLVPADAPTDAAGRAEAFITSFGLRAFRRPLTDDEVTTHVDLFNQGPTLYAGVDPFAAGASLVIQAMLQSPYFLYRTELGTAEEGATKVALDDWEVAAKLALTITNSIPDDALLAAAAAGELHDLAGVTKHANRLLEGTTGTVGISNLNFQVYRLGAYDGIVRNATDFPDFTPSTPAAMKAEALEFLSWVFRENLGVKDFYTAPVGFVNSELAPLYGLTGDYSSDPTMLTKVDLDPTQRAGLLTQPGFLSSYISIANEPDIIHRGLFIAERLLCREFPPPPAEAAGVKITDIAGLTNRERVETLTGKGTCGETCHMRIINPLGYAFENYDAIGRYRVTGLGEPVDAADSVLLDGEIRSFNNGVELSKLLSEAKDTHACYVKKMMTYLYGRDLDAAEKATVDYYARRSRAGMTLRDLELALVTSEDFLSRLP